MHRFVRGLRYMTRSDWAWLHAKLSLAFLCSFMTIYNPPSAVRHGLVSQNVILLVVLMMLMGGIISVIGILLRGTRIRPMIIGYAFELAGLIPLIAGPLLISGVYLWAAIEADVTSTLLGFAFTYSLAALLFARFIDIQQHHLSSKRTSRRELRRRSR